MKQILFLLLSVVSFSLSPPLRPFLANVIHCVVCFISIPGQGSCNLYSLHSTMHLRGVCKY